MLTRRLLLALLGCAVGFVSGGWKRGNAGGGGGSGQSVIDDTSTLVTDDNLIQVVNS